MHPVFRNVITNQSVDNNVLRLFVFVSLSISSTQLCRKSEQQYNYWQSAIRSYERLRGYARYRTALNGKRHTFSGQRQLLAIICVYSTTTNCLQCWGRLSMRPGVSGHVSEHLLAWRSISPWPPSAPHTTEPLHWQRRYSILSYYNTVLFDVVSETYEDMATGKRQIRRFQQPHSSLKTSQQKNAYEYLQMIIARNWSY